MIPIGTREAVPIAVGNAKVAERCSSLVARLGAGRASSNRGARFSDIPLQQELVLLLSDDGMVKAAKKPLKRTQSPAKPSHSATMQIVRAKTGVRTVRFGTVTATVARVDRGTETRNIRQGQAALKRASKTFAKPGVAPVRRKGVPSFHSDPKVKGRVVCVMNGTKTSGVFDSRGVFKAT